MYPKFICKQFISLAFQQKSPEINQDFYSIGGGEENRTPVRKALTTVFSERSLLLKIPHSYRQQTGNMLR